MQQLLVIVLFLAALGYLGWRAYRSFARKQAGCGKSCGCSGSSDSPRHMIINKSA